MALLLIRHGETEWNVLRRYQGHLDSPLTERGIAQAHAIARRLPELPEFDSAPVVTSPLGRARHTAEIICRNRSSSAFETDDRLREITLGSRRMSIPPLFTGGISAPRPPSTIPLV